MSRVVTTKRVIVLGLVLLIAFTAIAYVLATQRLAELRQARREDDLGRAETLLASTWSLPGLRAEVELEGQLMAVQQGDLRNEKALQSQALNGSKQSVMIREALAKGNLACFQWEQARQHAEAILDRQPKGAYALWLRGRALIEMQLEAQARQDFETALQSEPKSFVIRHSLADLLHKMGYVQRAIEHYQALVDLRPNDERLLLALAHGYQEQSRNDKATEIVDRLLAVRPGSVEALLERARLAMRAGQLEDAERGLRRALELRPNDSEANWLVRVALQAQKKSDPALDRRIHEKDLRQAELKTQLSKQGNRPEVLTSVGLWMMSTGEDDEVLGWLYSALKENANYRPAHAGLAQYFNEHGQRRRAQTHAKLAGSESTAIDQPHSSAITNSEAALGTTPRWARPDSSKHADVAEASSEQVQRLCAGCHAYPPPESMPRSSWRKEVKQGYDFLRRSSVAGDYPPLESVVAYYESRALENLPPIKLHVSSKEPPLKFEIRGTGSLPPRPGVTNANLLKLFGKKNQELLLCETQQNALMILKPYEKGPGGIVIPEVPSPCHTTICDLDLDGHVDILVASIGSFFPTDDKLGKVLWLKGKPGGQFDAECLLDGVGRVTDIQVADFNGDRQLDLVVSVYGWRSTGEILYLENQTSDRSQPKFVRHVVDERHGAIHLPVADLDGDNRPDFVGLVSQEHEAVVAYLNRGNDRFEPTTIYSAPHPSYGSSGIELVDLDGDRDLDVLLSNGDILDPPYLLKPYHGVQWLENTGTFPFKHHAISAMYGAMRAVAADFDGDGDQDIAAVSFLPSQQFPEREKLRIPAVVLFEQTAGTQFEQYVLETGTCDHFSCVAGDWDDDGRVDLAVTNYSWNGSQPMRDAATLWRNVGR